MTGGVRTESAPIRPALGMEPREGESEVEGGEDLFAVVLLRVEYDVHTGSALDLFHTEIEEEERGGVEKREMGGERRLELGCVNDRQMSVIEYSGMHSACLSYRVKSDV